MQGARKVHRLLFSATCKIHMTLILLIVREGMNVVLTPGSVPGFVDGNEQSARQRGFSWHDASELVTNLLHRCMCKEPLSCGPEDLGPLPANAAPTAVIGLLFCSL